MHRILSFQSKLKKLFSINGLHLLIFLIRSSNEYPRYLRLSTIYIIFSYFCLRYFFILLLFLYFYCFIILLWSIFIYCMGKFTESINLIVHHFWGIGFFHFSWNVSCNFWNFQFVFWINLVWLLFWIHGICYWFCFRWVISGTSVIGDWFTSII